MAKGWAAALMLATAMPWTLGAAVKSVTVTGLAAQALALASMSHLQVRRSSSPS